MQDLSFLDQPYPEPQLLKIECERLKVNRPFVKADRDPANLGMGFAPSVLRQRSTAFVNVTSLRTFNPERSLTPFKMHTKSLNFS
ncbi:hypothetical protein Clacol_005701 [Clathrus columnatus]|uniref:Uncharacterized protein n=1 Tax=Clathrus columnatus TaxID=1419009 RepID=A0AAV5AEB2_9AGAM|nr:hypothetical protein Clacol_005701 [Clathrus columnatus]